MGFGIELVDGKTFRREKSGNSAMAEWLMIQSAGKGIGRGSNPLEWNLFFRLAFRAFLYFFIPKEFCWIFYLLWSNDFHCFFLIFALKFPKNFPTEISLPMEASSRVPGTLNCSNTNCSGDSPGRNSQFSSISLKMGGGIGDRLKFFSENLPKNKFFEKLKF